MCQGLWYHKNRISLEVDFRTLWVEWWARHIFRSRSISSSSSSRCSSNRWMLDLEDSKGPVHLGLCSSRITILKDSVWIQCSSSSRINNHRLILWTRWEEVRVQWELFSSNSHLAFLLCSNLEEFSDLFEDKSYLKIY